MIVLCLLGLMMWSVLSAAIETNSLVEDLSASVETLLSKKQTYLVHFSKPTKKSEDFAVKFKRTAEKMDLLRDSKGFHFGQVDCAKLNCTYWDLSDFPSLGLFVDGMKVSNDLNIDYKDGELIDLAEKYSIYKGSIIDLTAQNFNLKLSLATFFVVKFYLPWCGHCQDYQPNFKEVSESVDFFDYRYSFSNFSRLLVFGQIDCDVYQPYCFKEVSGGFPEIHFYFKGRKIASFNGAKSSDFTSKFIFEKISLTSSDTFTLPADKPQHGAETDPNFKQKAEAIESQTEEEDNIPFGKVHDLDDGHFNEFISKGDWFIDFYAPWCSHCKALAPKMEEVGNFSTDVHIGKLDCTTNPIMAKKYEVKGYPTLFYFSNGIKVVEYRGSRSVKDMMSFIKKQKNPIQEVTKVSFEKVKMSHELFFVVSNISADIQSFSRVSEAPVFYFKEFPDTLAVYSNGKFKKYSGTPEDMLDWLKENEFPPVIRLDTLTSKKLFSDPNRLVALAIVDPRRETVDFKKLLLRLYENNQEKNVFFAWIDGVEYKKYVESFGIKQIPLVILIKGDVYYDSTVDREPIVLDEDGIKLSLKQAIEGSLEPKYLRTFFSRLLNYVNHPLVIIIFMAIASIAAYSLSKDGFNSKQHNAKSD